MNLVLKSATSQPFLSLLLRFGVTRLHVAVVEVKFVVPSVQVAGDFGNEAVVVRHLPFVPWLKQIECFNDGVKSC